MLHLGIDLDNTIIDYDRAFPAIAATVGMVPSSLGVRGKAQVKALLLARADGMADWMRLQGLVYGRYIDSADLYDGVEGFLRECRDAGVRISIVSHKTRHGHFDETRTNLWDAARDWLADRGFFRPDRLGLDPTDVHFEETRDAKVERIAALGCGVFIDDLPEVLAHPGFPGSVEKLWFAGRQPARLGEGLEPYRSWPDIARVLRRRLGAPATQAAVP